MNFSSTVINNNDIENIHENSLYLLQNYGAIFEDQKIIDIYRKHGAKIEGNKVKIPSKLIEEYLKYVPSEFSITSRNPSNQVNIGKIYPSVIAPAAGSVFVSSYSKGLQKATQEDFDNFISLSQLSKNIQVAQVGLLYTETTNTPGGFCNQIYNTILHCDKPLFGLTQDECIANHSINMAKIANGNENTYYTIGIINCLSPLQWDSKMLGALRIYSQKLQPLIISVTSQAGVSSSVKLNKTILQNNAEILSGIITTQLISKGTPIIYGSFSAASDFKTLNIAVGTPESQILAIAGSQLASYYNIPFRSGGGLSDSIQPDIQAGIETAFNLYTALTNKFDFILQGIGSLASLSAVSYEKWVLDEEICDKVKYLHNFNFKEISTEDVQDIICNLETNNSFMMSDETLLKYKEELFNPSISQRKNIKKQSKDRNDILVFAEKAWKKKLKNYYFPPISKSILKDLDNYLNRI